MRKKFKEIVTYLTISISFTWFFWILSMYLAIKNNTYIPIDERMFSIFNNGFNSNIQFVVSMLFFIGVFGPIVGLFYLKYKYHKKITLKKSKLNYKDLMLIVLATILIFSLSLLIPLLIDRVRFEYFVPIKLGLILFVVQSILSFPIIFGWFTYIYPYFKKEYKLIKGSYLLGLLWALSTVPTIIYLSYQYQPIYILINIVGTFALVLPLTLILAWIYEKTKNIFIIIIAYSCFKTMMMMFFAMSIEIVMSVLSLTLLLWLINYYILEKNKECL